MIHSIPGVEETGVGHGEGCGLPWRGRRRGLNHSWVKSSVGRCFSCRGKVSPSFVVKQVFLSITPWRACCDWVCVACP